MNFHVVRAPVAALGLATALFLVIAAISATSLWQGYQDALSRGEQRALTASQTVAAHFQWMIEASRQALRRLDDTVGFRPELLTVSQLGDIDEAIKGLPASVDARIFDARGGELLSTRPDAGELKISDREYFQSLRDGDEFVISALLVDRVTKQQSFVVAKRLVRGGEFAGIAAIVVPTDLIVTFWASLGLGADSATSVFRDDGWLVTRYPRLEEVVNAADQALFTVHLQRSPNGAFIAHSLIDDTSRIIGYHRVQGAPLVAVAAIAYDTALADFRVRLRRLALSLIPVVIGLFGFSWWVSRLLISDAKQRVSLESALEQNRLLFREIHHRVKNNLQTVASLVRLQSLPQEAKRDLANRIAAMAAVHEQIYRSGQLGEMDLGTYLNRLIHDIELGFDRPVAVKCDFEPVTIHAERASVVGLIVTEVISNSLKHAFPSDREGKINVTLAHADDDRIRLEVRDNGVGFDAETSSSGLGHKLIKSFTRQLGGDYTLGGDGGLNFVLEFPADPGEEELEAPAD
ncbi:MAG: histidine kinase dimerization/phosphoacceptor domain -containing protein [Rhizobiaceae bacterium]